MRTPQKLALVLLASSLLTTACGARLTDDQRTQALAQGGGSGGSTSGAGTGAEGELTTGDTTGTGTTGATGTTGSSTTGATGTTGAGTGGTAGTGGSTGTAGTGGTGGTGGSGPITNTRDMPPGGNGGKTGPGITADTITIANISDVSGAVPGLFEDAQFAVKAAVAYFNASERTIYGRKIRLLSLDSRLDTGANRAKSIQACNEAFAGVGSVSAFDQGGAPVIRDCGLADLRGLSTTTQMKEVKNAIPMNAAGNGGQRSLGTYGWAAKQNPEAVKKAAYFFIDGEVTRQLTDEDIKGAEAALGYKFIKKFAVDISETNYQSFVQQMKSAGVRYVTFVGAYQQAVNLAKTMSAQGFKPDIYAPTVTAYTPNFISQAGAAAEGTYIAVAPSLNEEISANKELQLYAQWLNQVEPGATPTGIGQYAWSAARLFFEQMKKLGPRVTRQQLIDSVTKIRAYDGNGLFPPNDIGGRTLTDCVIVVQVKGGKFVRHEPAGVGKRRCGDGVFDTKTGRIVGK